MTITAGESLSENTIDFGDLPDIPRQAAGPLAGLRVLDLGTVYAAPITAMLLGDWGADVIKVEHPRGDPARTHGLSKDGHGLWWKVIARNKRTITLNFSKPDGQDILRRLVAQADVVIENFRPGVLEKWGLGPDELQKINPELVVLRVTGFGQTGPVRQPAGVRHAGRGDERAGPPDRARRTARRPCRRSDWPTESPG